MPGRVGQSVTGHALAAWLRRFALLACLAIGACQAAPTVQLPADSAEPHDVLIAYLRALMARECATALALTTEGGAQQVADYCGPIRVRSFQVRGDPAAPNDQERVFSTTLNLQGGEPSLPDGDNTIFFQLIRQPNGAWRIAGGGTGP